MMRRRRDEIEWFCRNFLQGNDHQLHKLITNYRHMLSQIDIQQRQFTKDTSDGSSQNICNEIFAHRHVSNGYIIASETVRKHHCSSSWYTIDKLTNSLVNILEGVGFHPGQLLVPSHCIIL